MSGRDYAARARRSSCARPKQVLAQVEEPGPERAAIGARLEPDRGREPLERPDQDGELEVRRRDPVRIGVDAGADRAPAPSRSARPALGSPNHERPSAARARARAGSGRAAPRAPSSAVSTRSAASCSAAERAPRSTAPPRRGPSARAAGRTRAPRPRAPRARRSALAPPVAGLARVAPRSPRAHARIAHVSTTTGRIIGRRRVRS